MLTHQIIKAGRLKLELTEKQFGAKLGLSRGTVQQWEKEGGTAPTRKHQPGVARLLGISVAELMHPESSKDDQVPTPGRSVRAQIIAAQFDMVPKHLNKAALAQKLEDVIFEWMNGTQPNSAPAPVANSKKPSVKSRTPKPGAGNGPKRPGVGQAEPQKPRRQPSKHSA